MAKYQSKGTPTYRTLFLLHKIHQNAKAREESSIKGKGKKVCFPLGNEKSASPFSAMALHFMKEQEDGGEELVYQTSNDPKAKWQQCSGAGRTVSIGISLPQSSMTTLFYQTLSLMQFALAVNRLRRNIL